MLHPHRVPLLCLCCIPQCLCRKGAPGSGHPGMWGPGHIHVAEQVSSGPWSGPWVGIRCERVTVSVTRLGPGEVRGERRGKGRADSQGTDCLPPLGCQGPLRRRQALGVVRLYRALEPLGAARWGRAPAWKDSHALPRCKGVRVGQATPASPEPCGWGQASCRPLLQRVSPREAPGTPIPRSPASLSAAGREPQCSMVRVRGTRLVLAPATVSGGLSARSSAVVLQPCEGPARQQPDPEHGSRYCGRHHSAGQ